MKNAEWKLRRANGDLFFVVRSLCFVLRAIQLLGASC
jgi:hypothetical protein